MKGEGHLGKRRDKTVYFTRLRGQGQEGALKALFHDVHK